MFAHSPPCILRLNTKPFPPIPMKRILIIAGPNGAGKTTFAEEFLPHEADCPEFVNADLIAAGLSPFRPDSVAFTAGRLMMERIESLVASGSNFALETTLATRSWATRIPQWQAKGFQVALHFIQLPNPEFAVKRVRHRVQNGGHDIPEQVIRRRFERGLVNLEKTYRQLVDQWFLYDGSHQPPRLYDAGGDDGSDTLMEDAPPYRPKLANKDLPPEFLARPDVQGALAALARGAAKAVARARAAGLEPVVANPDEADQPASDPEEAP